MLELTMSFENLNLYDSNIENTEKYIRSAFLTYPLNIL